MSPALAWFAPEWVKNRYLKYIFIHLIRRIQPGTNEGRRICWRRCKEHGACEFFRLKGWHILRGHFSFVMVVYMRGRSAVFYRTKCLYLRESCTGHCVIVSWHKDPAPTFQKDPWASWGGLQDGPIPCHKWYGPWLCPSPTLYCAARNWFAEVDSKVRLTTSSLSLNQIVNWIEAEQRKGTKCCVSDLEFALVG